MEHEVEHDEQHDEEHEVEHDEEHDEEHYEEHDKEHSQLNPERCLSELVEQFAPLTCLNGLNLCFLHEIQ